MLVSQHTITVGTSNCSNVATDLKHLLISILPFVLFYKFQILIYTTAMLDLRDALITQGHKAKTTLLKI